MAGWMLRVSVAALVSASGCAVVWAQYSSAAGPSQTQAPLQNSAPSHAAVASQTIASQMPVARLSHLSGTVSVQSEDATDAAADAALNMPLPAGERLISGDDGEAEIEFADGSVLRMTPDSVATIEQMDPVSRGTTLDLGNGLFYLELRASDRGSYMVNAGDLILTPEENAAFRVRVKDGQAEMAVLAGSVSATRPNAYTAALEAGESLRTDPKNGKRYLLADTVSPEDWDSWNEKLAQVAQDQEASQTPVRDSYAGEQGYGWADLDANGNWYDVPGEGPVWQPAALDASFDPYGYGSWVYGTGGYAWASGYGWGWLPYRCGAWSFFPAFGWGWSPSSGCLNFGFGGGFGAGGGGGVRLGHGPSGWNPPHRPLLTGDGGVLRRHPTIPVRFRPLENAGIAPVVPHASNEPVRIGGMIGVPVKRIGREVTPQGGSAVGSSFMRDFPVRAGTHEAVLGQVSQAPVALPGRTAEWHGVRTVAAGSGAGSGSVPGVANGGNGAAGGTARARAAGSSSYPNGRVPQPTDPPVGANGVPPLDADGPPPVGANGSLAGGNAVGQGAGEGEFRGELLLRSGGGRQGSPVGPNVPPVAPIAGNLPPASQRTGTALPPRVPIAVATPRPVAPVSIPAPRVYVPPPAPAAPSAPAAPVAPAVHTR